MLLLFDVDATLVSTSQAGILSLVDAGRELHGSGFDIRGTDFAGRLDPLIIRDLLHNNGIDPTPEQVSSLRAGYARHLAGRLRRPGTAQALPGVLQLLAELEGLRDHAPPEVPPESRPTLGLLTGNWEDTGRLKLTAAGIEADRFDIAVWGDHSPHDPPAREHLPPVAMERARAAGRPADPAQVTIIGDTPHDVACALASGCRCLAVATGHTDTATLRQAGAHHAVDDLTDTARILDWLLQR